MRDLLLKSRHPGQVGPEEDFRIWKTIWFGWARLWGALSQFVSSVPVAELPRPGKARNLEDLYPTPVRTEYRVSGAL